MSTQTQQPPAPAPAAPNPRSPQRTQMPVHVPRSPIARWWHGLTPSTRMNMQRIAALVFFIAIARIASADGPPQANLRELQSAFQEVAQRVSPSVVAIRTVRNQVTRLPGTDGDGQALRVLEHSVVVNGSGTVVTADGLILTNQHVIQDAVSILVAMHDGTRLDAKVVSSDARSDLAILCIDKAGLTPAKFCDWSNVARGQWTIAIGNPFGLGNDGQLSVSTGVISNLDRRLPGLGESDDRRYSDMVQTTTSINPGNSGGPLFNIDGQLIGVITAMHTRAAADEGVGFAIPMTPARRAMIDRLCSGTRVEYGYLGVRVRPLDATQTTTAKKSRDGKTAVAGATTEARGVLIEVIEPDGPAARAELREGDIILSIGGQAVRSATQLVDIVSAATIGSELSLAIERSGKRLDKTIRVERREPLRAEALREDEVLWRGCRFVDAASRGDSGRKAERVGVLVVEIAADATAAITDLRVGDIIEQIDGVRIDSIAAFRKQIAHTQGPLKIRLRGRGEIQLGGVDRDRH